MTSIWQLFKWKKPSWSITYYINIKREWVKKSTLVTQRTLTSQQVFTEGL